MKRALLVGLGGIGSNVYSQQLAKLNYRVDTVDTNSDIDSTYADISEVKDDYDVAVICVPNHLHEPIAKALAKRCKTMLVEKPGFQDALTWDKFCTREFYTQTVLVKNNLYRNSYGKLLDRIDEIEAVEMNWINKNRVPNPGSWFTDKSKSYGGVAHDLLPHLLCFTYKMFGDKILHLEPEVFSTQKWDLNNLKTTDYGAINPDGTYNVDDYAEAFFKVGEVPVVLRAAWKDGYDDQTITVYYKDNTSYKWKFGLCPANAYKNMIETVPTETRGHHLSIDYFIHSVLEKFNES